MRYIHLILYSSYIIHASYFIYFKSISFLSMYFFTYALSKKQTHPNELIKSRTGNPFPREENKQKIHTFFFKVRDDITNAPIGALEVKLDRAIVLHFQQ